uniref:Retrovirus-related Pol polyprotein from transposon 17.6 n=1 Tax=Cajanus cajan TaxID=3821 RepID=A0A151UFC4_CAJCA
MLKKNNFLWSNTAKLSFQQLKRNLTEAPVLGLPDFSKLFIVEMDASGLGIGAVLMQDQHPIAYISRHLNQQH